jgi:hypothetical protein
MSRFFDWDCLRKKEKGRLIPHFFFQRGTKILANLLALKLKYVIF